MLLSAVSVLVVAQSSSEVPEGLMNNPVLELWFLIGPEDEDWNELDYRVDVCRITKGAHIEHL